MAASRPRPEPSGAYDRAPEHGRIASARARWEAEVLGPALARSPERRDAFATMGGIPVDRLYLPGSSDPSRLGMPGEYPFTRGIHPTMYRSRLWSMRMFSGFGTPEDTNRRFRYLLSHGESGLSIAFDDPTLYGIDADDPEALGEVGKCGVSVSSLEDMRRLLRGVPLDRVTTSMTINGPANIIWGMYVLSAEAAHVPRARLGGTTQNDILKEYTAQKEFLYPPAPALRLVVDTIEFATREMPQWNPVSISGYHIREAGSTAVQELAFTLADGIAYVEATRARGIPVDDFAPRLSFFFNSHNDFFEEIAKFRAARRVWATVMRDRFGAKNERSWWMRFHTQTAGCSCTAQQPELNIVRTTIQALAGVIGGTQSLHTNSYDEALQLPSEDAVRIALRTQQILAHESGVPKAIDPFGGSYYVEWLTDRMEEEAFRYFDRIDEMGGVVAAIDRGFFQREIQESSFRYQRAVEGGEAKVVGVNAYTIDEPVRVPRLKISEAARRDQARRLTALRSRRNPSRHAAALDRLRRVAETERENTMPAVLDALKARATLGEIVRAFQDVYGRYRERSTY
ncbi:MAG: methylmalonyl-CoA mutase family protein [Candidatus Thermoplasmatota archaeon]|jgi:methylmalonyl-CoA mutase N-terminal domain/subunit|nr:methylmalonyl-CoA mutase family protein [Candidatus Thermoplasmatota archaeon]